MSNELKIKNTVTKANEITLENVFADELKTYFENEWYLIYEFIIIILMLH